MQSLQNASQLIGRHERDIPSAAPPNDDYVAVFSYLIAQFREICARLRVSSLSLHIAYLSCCSNVQLYCTGMPGGKQPNTSLNNRLKGFGS